MRIKAASLLSAMLVATLATPVYVQAANPSMEETFNKCQQEAESNEVEDKDMRTWLKRCMTDSGMTAADADTTLNELGPPAEKSSGDSSGS
jgi:pseudouridine-5'-phosphate glycosidase